ncbi:MAG: DUF3108 domain-containing protein [Patescibacteria group bacterium]|jgi:hypothetical protein
MKTLLICLLLVQGLHAAELEKYSGECLEYDLEWNPFWGIITPKAGEASFSFDRINNGWQAQCEVHTIGWARKRFVYDNYIVTNFDSAGTVMWSKSFLTDSTWVEWQVDQNLRQVCYWENDTLVDVLNLAGNMPLEALSAFYLFRNMNLELGQSSELKVFGIDDSNRARMSKAIIQVKDQVLLKWHGYKYLCWVVEIRMNKQDNFIPSGRVTIWVTCNSNRLPLKVATDFVHKGRTYPVFGVLKKDGP